MQKKIHQGRVRCVRGWVGWFGKYYNVFFYFLPVGMGANKLSFSDAPGPAGTLLSASGSGIYAWHLRPLCVFFFFLFLTSSTSIRIYFM